MSRKADPAEIARLAAEGHSQSVIADMIGVSRERIRQICNRDGIETLSGRRDWDFRDRLPDLIARGLTVMEIARETGRQPASVRVVLRSEGLAPLAKWKRPGVSGYRGVSLHKQSGLWRASARRDGQRVSLGYYQTPEAAYAARCEWEAAQ